jgi:hypothetical protein
MQDSADARCAAANSIDFVDSAWVDSAERPFDPPLTAAGVAQGTALGRRLRDFSPPVSKIFVSPLGRTVQTACAAAAELGGPDLPLFIEPGLVEVLDAGWYRCWQCSPSDTRAADNAASLLMSAEQLRGVSKRVDTSYAPIFDVASLGVRLRCAALRCAAPREQQMP